MVADLLVELDEEVSEVEGIFFGQQDMPCKVMIHDLLDNLLVANYGNDLACGFKNAHGVRVLFSGHDDLDVLGKVFGKPEGDVGFTVQVQHVFEVVDTLED